MSNNSPETADLFKNLRQSYIELAKTRSYQGSGKVTAYRFFNRHLAKIYQNTGKKCGPRETGEEWAKLT